MFVASSPSFSKNTNFETWTLLDLCSKRLGVASTRANIVQVVGEVAGVAALAVGDTTSQEVKDS